MHLTYRRKRTITTNCNLAVTVVMMYVYQFMESLWQLSVVGHMIIPTTDRETEVTCPKSQRQ